jgi:putative endonuclease
VEKTYFVYLATSGPFGALYTGVTNNLVRRFGEHNAGLVPGFTARYAVDQLVWFEVHTLIDAAIAREKQIKRWKREWKINLFRESNPHWNDLYPSLTKGIWG